MSNVDEIALACSTKIYDRIYPILKTHRYVSGIPDIKAFIQVQVTEAIQKSKEGNQDIILVGLPHFEDDQPCGYCGRPIGEPHREWCRQ